MRERHTNIRMYTKRCIRLAFLEGVSRVSRRYFIRIVGKFFPTALYQTMTSFILFSIQFNFQFRVTGVGACPSCQWVRQMIRTTIHTHSQSSVTLTCTFLGSGKEWEYPGRTHRYTRRNCKLQTERPQPGSQAGTLLEHSWC